MVTPLSVAVTIWAKTITIVILICIICAIVSHEIWGLFGALALVFGFFITTPLLAVISPLVKCSSRIPYANRSRLAWLIFFLALMYLLISIGLLRIMGNGLEAFLTGEGSLFMLSIIIVQFIAVRTTRKSLYELYEQHKCSHE